MGGHHVNELCELDEVRFSNKRKGTFDQAQDQNHYDTQSAGKYKYVSLCCIYCIFKTNFHSSR